ncbi:Ig-like domain repeat protein [Pendulispora rubella]|uniref:Ig-like domain repeat protein n=1 Tax=Pendulispora rubella TaxID=2741070 RepID=A0ABZ2L287_9BACT
MLRWLIGIIVGFGLWLIAGTAGAQEPPPLTCPQPLSGQIDSPGDPKQTNRINQGVAATTCEGQVPAPGIIQGQFGYDKYTFKNRAPGADACMVITLKATGDVNSGRGLSAVAYVDSFDPANIATNFIGHTGNIASPGTNPNTNTRIFRVKVPALKDFVVVVNEVFDGGGGTYDLLVEGCGRILISEISPNFGPSAGGTEVTIKGAGFRPESTVTFGGVLGTNLQFVSEFEIRVTTPAYTGGGTSPHAVDVAVTAGPGDPVVKPNGFTYYDKANTVLTLTPSPAIIVYGQGPSLIGAITPAKNPNAPTGSITFLEGTRVLGGGQINPANSTGRIVIGAASVGTHEYKATYVGDAFYNPAESAIATLIVNRSPTTTTLTSSQNPSGPGDEVTFTAIVRGPYATNTTGTVTFNEDGTDLPPVTMVNGRASVPRTYAAVGQHTITARYSGDENFLPTPDPTPGRPLPTVIQNVTATAPDITITPTPADVTYGQDVTLNIKVATRAGASAPTGTIQLNIDDQNVGAAVPLNAGEVTFPARKLLGGTHIIKAVYSGDPNYTAGTATLPFEVKPAPTTTTVVSSKPGSAVGEAVTFTATISSNVQNGVALTGTVQFMDGEEKIGLPVTLAAGAAKVEGVKLPQGTRKVTAVYSGDTNYATSTSPSIDQVVGGGGVDGGTDSGKPDAGTDSGTVKPDASGVDSGSGGNGGNASTEGGGCDCNTTGTPASGLMALLGGLGFALMLVRRRRA